MTQNTDLVSPGIAAAGETSAYEPATVVRHLAHELRQPLSTIESIAFYLEMVLPRAEGKARRQLGKLQSEVHQINWILNDAIHFLQAAPVKLELMDLTEVVDKSLEDWKAEAGEGVCLRLTGGLPLVRLDVEQMQHLLRNVIAFFGRIAAPGRAITVRTYAGDGEAVLEVEGTVPEYRADDIQQLLEPFDPHFPSGSGLALASVRRIAEAHGARLALEHGPASSIVVAIGFPAV